MDVISRTKSAVSNHKLGRLVVGRGAADLSGLGVNELIGLVLTLEDAKGNVRGISEEAMDAIQIHVEGYTLDIPADGSAATLKAKSTLGLYRGLATFQHL